MFWARVSAVAVLVIAALWIGSGYLRTEPAATRATTEKALFRVVVAVAEVVDHARRLELTGRTESDQRVVVTARTNGIVTRLTVRRGSQVKVGDPIAELSDEAREANVAQAKARLAQRSAELEAREQLARRGSYPSLNIEQLRAEKQAAEAALATAEAELERATILAPIAGFVNAVPAEQGQAIASGATLAEILAPDPMLAVVEVPERRLGGISPGAEATIRLVTGETRMGTVRFVARRPGGATRTYRVDIAFANPDAAIPDGIAAEVSLRLAPVKAARVPRSALTFSSEGQLGLRVVDADDVVRFVPVSLIDDADPYLWVAGPENGQRIITRGQDFIREGQKVAPVAEAGS